MDKYNYRFSAVVEEYKFKKMFISRLKKLGLSPLEHGNIIIIEGEDKFENCMAYMARFLHFDEHEFYLSRRG